MQPLTLEQRHEGAYGESGRFTGYIKDKMVMIKKMQHMITNI